MFTLEQFLVEQIFYHMLSPWYITGFCEGESAFTYNRQGQYNINLYFAIRLRADDKELLTKIKNFFGVGRLYQVKARPPGRFSGNTQTAIYYRVNKHRELARIIEHFDQYPLTGKKTKNYQLWKEIYLLKAQYKKSVYPHIWELISEISKLSSKNTTSKANIKHG